jgi:hypothetical protein
MKRVIFVCHWRCPNVQVVDKQAIGMKRACKIGREIAIVAPKFASSPIPCWLRRTRATKAKLGKTLLFFDARVAVANDGQMLCPAGGFDLLNAVHSVEIAAAS